MYKETARKLLFHLSTDADGLHSLVSTSSYHHLHKLYFLKSLVALHVLLLTIHIKING